jgi:predicted dinucleotide-binding enzyme
MKIGIVGAGDIGGNLARQFVRVGHEVLVSFSREPSRLDELAAELGPQARVGTPGEAATFGDVVVISVPWGLIDDVLADMGSLEGRVVVDTTNQFGPGGALDLGGHTAARHNAERMVGARYTKSFNTLTAAFQAATAGRTGESRVVQWVAGDDGPAKDTLIGLIDECGWLGIDLGGIDDCAVMEAPRRPGAVYGEEYRGDAAAAVVAAVRSRGSIPATPHYDER